MKRLGLPGIGLTAALIILLGTAPAALADSPVWDNFNQPFSVATAPGAPNAKWFYFSAGPFVGDDGSATTGSSRLRVVAVGTNPTTGQPAFTKTLAPESQNGGLPGGIDHVKWLVYMNHLASSGFPGFDAVPGRELTCEATLGGRTFGTAGQPFGAAVANPNDDLRLAATAMNVIDFDTFMVFDFFLTNERIYAFYEHLPFGRGGTYGNYAAFSYAIPVAARSQGDLHRLAIAYDKGAGTVRWLIEGKEVFRVSAIGMPIDRRYQVLDHGGTPAIFSPNQLDCGMGMFTLLDAGAGPSRLELVRLSETPGFYFNPRTGGVPSFVDIASLPGSRLFGQGAELWAKKYSVYSR